MKNIFIFSSDLTGHKFICSQLDAYLIIDSNILYKNISGNPEDKL